MMKNGPFSLFKISNRSWRRVLLHRNISILGHDRCSISLQLSNQSKATFSLIFLRDASPNLLDPSSFQKTFNTGELSPSITVGNAHITPQQALTIEWSDGTTGIYPKTFLVQYAKGHSRAIEIPSPKIWSSSNLPAIHSLRYEDYISPNDNDGYRKALKHLWEDGIFIITDIPTNFSEDSSHSPYFVESIAQRISYVKNTFYGTSWDVRSVTNAKNVAYTSVYLPLHMDLCYYETPPGVQLLHVLNNSTSGGESLFADSFAAANYVKEVDIDAYRALVEMDITFHYDHADHYYYYRRPTVVESEDGTFAHVNYSPPFQGPLESLLNHPEREKDLLRGLKLFDDYIENPENQIEFRAQEGTCMVFMNRRLLHGRRQFENSSGIRHFQGTYIDEEAIMSQVRLHLKPQVS